jgi:penicillin-binding protein A
MFGPTYSSGSGSVRWLQPVNRRRRRRIRIVPILIGLLVLAGAGTAAAIVLTRQAAGEHRKEAAERFARAWAKRDLEGMWRQLSPQRRKDWPLRDFRASYREADTAASVTAVRPGTLGEERASRIPLPVTVKTRDFGALRGTISLPIVEVKDKAYIDWGPRMRLPGLRAGERVRRRVLARPTRASVLSAGGTRLSSSPYASALAGTPPGDGEKGSGLEAMYDRRLGGRPGAQLKFGKRVIRQVKVKRGHSVRTTIRLGLQQAAASALGGKLGAVAIVQPRTGDILGMAGLAVSGPQPPGSTFKIITLSGALQTRVASPSDSYPVRTHAVLSGVSLANASNESCGGSLATSFADSCNSVFAPLGAKLGRRRLVSFAEKFGFNEPSPVPGGRPSTIAHDLKDSLAVGAAAIGQERDLATAVTMASVGGTIGNRGMRARPRLVKHVRVHRRRVVSTRVAGEVRDMMLGVVRGGTGTAAAIPGVEVAGKTGTAELRPTAGGPSDPKNTDAWFVAFAPAAHPKVAVAVMLVGAGAGGAAAAPIARQVLLAAL